MILSCFSCPCNFVELSSVSNLVYYLAKVLPNKRSLDGCVFNYDVIMCLKWMSNNYLSLHLQVISQVFWSAIKILGNMSKYQSINWVAIFSDPVFDWYRIEWNGISNGSSFFMVPINRGHQILTYINQRLSKCWNCWSHYVTHKNYIMQCMNDWVFNAQTGWARPTVYSPVVFVFLKCVFFHKKLATNALNKDFLWMTIPKAIQRIFVSNCFIMKQWIIQQCWRKSISKRKCTGCISDLWIKNMWLKNPCWRNFTMF